MHNRKLIEMISALLALDEKRALVPHGLGGHARELLQRSVAALADYDALLAQPSDDALTCCTPTFEERALLAAGDFTPEELWGGSNPSCPKCVGGALTSEGVEPVAWTYMHKGQQPYSESLPCLAWSSESIDIMREGLKTGDHVHYHPRADLYDWRPLFYGRPPAPASVAFQLRVQPWMTACFGETIAGDCQERNHRFLEEALELVQACGATAGEAHQLVDYVYGRAVGEIAQEVGGVMVTLAALCLAQGMDMHQAAEAELSRIWTKVEQIRAKQAAKPAIGPLPGAYPNRQP